MIQTERSEDNSVDDGVLSRLCEFPGSNSAYQASNRMARGRVWLGTEPKKVRFHATIIN